MAYTPKSKTTRIDDSTKKKIFADLASNKKIEDIKNLAKISDDIDGRVTETENDIVNLQESKQDVLVSGVNIKTINGETILGSGDIVISSGSSKIKRHDFTSSYSYCGTAPSGSLEASSVWNIERILVAENGTTTVTTATNVAWTDRYTATYT
jgi:hypothetical protein